MSTGKQEELPKLPVPKLEDTLKRYYDRLVPLMSQEEAEKQKKIVDKFMKNEAPILHEALLEYNKTRESYVAAFWNDSYLTPISTVVLNLNPFFVLADDPTPERGNQIFRAASLVFSALKFVCSLRSGTLANDMAKDKPLCMSQYHNLFGSSRIAGVEKDKFVVFPPNEATHIVVIRRQQLYYFECLNENNTVALNEFDICKNLAAIVADADRISHEEATKSAVGILTTEDRTIWAKMRQKLEANQDNGDNLKTIDQALFVLCLDHNSPQTGDELAANALHGTYSLENNVQVGTCTNRWYDKLQLVVCENGAAGVNFEHSGVDGHTVLRFVSDVFADTILKFAQRITKTMPSGGNYVDSLFNVKVEKNGRETYPFKLEWKLDLEEIDAIRVAEVRISDKICQCDTEVLDFTDYGKSFIVSNKLSPDAVVQLAIQFGYWKLYGRFASQYEPAQTKTFRHGRTEAIRALTPELIEFCLAFDDDSKTNAQKLEALAKATKRHSDLTREASIGQGPERHLFALRNIAAMKDMPDPEIFSSYGWRELNNTILSTSNCGNPSLAYFGFGPVVQDGFGIGYIIKDDSISFVVTSHHRQTHRYISDLRGFFLKLREILTPDQAVVVLSRQSKKANNSDTDGTNSEISSEMNGYDMWNELEFHQPEEVKNRKRSVGHAIMVVSQQKKNWKEKSGRKAGGEHYHFGDFTRAGIKSIKNVLGS
eukprot:c20556_g2_i1.p1 GENE.c20556_g2_i1~~c20556_g2_i1.p1  ORF type:complete len:719 (+),score=321.10 c20556_g2_i1:24-2159(+)